MKAKLKKLTQSKFARNVAIVATGTAGAQAITMAFAPLITRIYGPEAFGLLGVFMALIAILTPIAALTYPTAIVLPKEDADAKGIAKLAFWLALIISTLTAIILFFVGEAFLRLIGSEAISAYVMLIPLAMFFAAMLQITQQWLIRKKQFKITAKIAVVQSLIVNSAKTGFGWLNPTAAVLIIIATLGAALHAAMMAIGVKQNPKAQSISNFSYPVPETKDLLYEYKDFARYQTPHQLLNSLSQVTPVMLLAAFAGPASVGFYVLAKSVLAVPSSLIGTSVGSVFYPNYNEAFFSNKMITPILKKVIFTLALIGFFPFLIISIISPIIFPFIFSSDWSDAGVYAQWLVIWVFFVFINQPAFKAMMVLGKQKFLLKVDILFFILRFSVMFYVLSTTTNPVYGIISYSIVSAIYNFIIIYSSIFFSKNHDGELGV